MSSPVDPPYPAANLRTMQIIVAGLTMGLVSFLAIVLFLTQSGAMPGGPPVGGPAPAGAERAPILTFVATGMALALVPASVLVPSLLVKAGRRNLLKRGTADPAGPAAAPENAGALLGLYQTQMIVGAALNEAPAFMALIAYLIERSPVSLGLAVLMIVGVAARFPTRAKLDAWLDAQATQLDLERQGLA